MFAYVNEPETNVIVDTEGENVTFDELIECLWDCMELNIVNYATFNLGNDCIGCSMLGYVNGLCIEINFNDRDLHTLNKDGATAFYLAGTIRETWMAEHND